MDISTKELARVTIIEVRGRVDHQTHPDLAQVVDQLVRARKYNIVIDLHEVDYISSAGLTTLMSARKQTQGKGDVRLVAPSALVGETLKLVGFDHIFKIYPDLVEAVGSF